MTRAKLMVPISMAITIRNSFLWNSKLVQHLRNPARLLRLWKS